MTVTSLYICISYIYTYPYNFYYLSSLHAYCMSISFGTYSMSLAYLLSKLLLYSCFYTLHILCKFLILSCSFPFLFIYCACIIYFHITYLIMSCTFIYILILFIYGTFEYFNLVLFMYYTFICLLPVIVFFIFQFYVLTLYVLLHISFLILYLYHVSFHVVATHPCYTFHSSFSYLYYRILSYYMLLSCTFHMLSSCIIHILHIHLYVLILSYMLCFRILSVLFLYWFKANTFIIISLFFILREFLSHISYLP